MKDIQCKCGSTSYHEEKAGPHVKAVCNECGSYIQFLPQGATDETIMYYGKYKGKTLKEIPPDYLVWMYDNSKLNGSIKAYVAERLEQFKQRIFNAK